MALIAIRVPVGFTTGPTGQGSVSPGVTQGYFSSVTFVASVTGVAPSWTISAAGMPLAQGSGNQISAGPFIVGPGEQLTLAVFGATPGTNVVGSIAGVYATEGIAELPPASAQLSTTFVQPGQIGIIRQYINVICSDNGSGGTGELIPGVANQTIKIHYLSWNFVPIDNAGLNSPPPAGTYVVILQNDSGGVQGFDFLSLNVATPVGGLSSPRSTLDLLDHPITGALGAGLQARMASPLVSAIPTAGVEVTGLVLYTQQ